jgi:hypothetical protein
MTAVGALLIALPLAIGMSHAAAATGLAVGVLATALGLAGTADTGRGTLPLSTQHAYDPGLGVGLLLAALVFGVGGEWAATGLFLALGAVVLVLTSTTRYTLGRTQDFLE